jgi:NIMA (never in mitosis gene a)-related kinase
VTLLKRAQISEMNALTRGEGFYGIGSCLQERGYTPLKVIGRGSQGTVTLVKCEQKHQKLVVKQVTMDGLSESEREAALQECRLLHELSHPNIVEYVDSFLAADTFPGSPRCLHLVMQYCEGGDLAARIKYQKSDGGGRGVLCSESQVLDWFCQLALAVDWLHSRRVLHRDIKTSNIFLTERQILKLGDFGISKQLSSTCDKADTVIGTPYYMR